MDLKNKVAVISGGSKGIGKGIAVRFAKAGANIVFTHLPGEEENVALAAKEIESYGVKCLTVKTDISIEDDVIQLVQSVKEKFGKINILVNNAGTIGNEMPLSEMPTEEWDKLMNVDLRGVFLMCKYFIPLFDKENAGKIINISSELSVKGRANFTHYTAAKGGVNSLTRSLALELAPDILVNTIAPGPIGTDMILADMEPEWIEKEKDIPLQRLGTVEEIAATALLLASDEGNFFCGQFISPNGGAIFI
ncbi:SDR family oxidoreductase [Gracilibacillus oryzae]|uniref:SDR family oxidoreductase n=1 Tax=Gracilibacillus oryzae TaxID=1672701 RepID=A0A7C8GTT2_9BACI|nr:SDR family oxidoreductase [Gracilibacillus oryzae]KAB8137840.1 SDR family oxidoreductase [Gracilibacillus oryzae]